jgi:hypothetical protein
MCCSLLRLEGGLFDRQLPRIEASAQRLGLILRRQVGGSPVLLSVLTRHQGRARTIPSEGGES